MVSDDYVIDDEYQDWMKTDYYPIPHKLFQDEYEEAEEVVEEE
jgi:hypothetical protein